MANVMYRVLKLTVIGAMCSSLYFIDNALGKGLAIGLLRILCRSKCFAFSYASSLPPLKDVPEMISNRGGSIPLMLCEFAVFTAVMLLLSRSRNNIENKVDKLLIQSKIKLKEAYNIVDKINMEQKADRDFVKRLRRVGPFNSDFTDDFYNDASLTELPHKKVAASGDCAESTSRHVFCPLAVDGGDVIRITGLEDEDIEQIFGLDRGLKLCGVIMDDDVVIDDYFDD